MSDKKLSCFIKTESEVADEMPKRIALVISHFKTKTAAAKCAGVDVNTLARWTDTRRIPNPKLHQIANMLLGAGISLDWLVTGKGDCYLPDRHLIGSYSGLREAATCYSYNRYAATSSLSPSEHSHSIAQPLSRSPTQSHSLSQSADDAILCHSDKKEHCQDHLFHDETHYPFVSRESTIHQELIPLVVFREGKPSTTCFPITRHELHARDISRDSIKAFHLEDDAMAPTLCAGALILVDTSSLQPVGAALYLVEFHGAQLVRRLQRTISGLTLICDTPLLKDIHVPEEALDQLTIIGKIVWSSGWL